MKRGRYVLLRLARVGLAAWAILSCIFLLSRLTAGDDVVRTAFDAGSYTAPLTTREKLQAETLIRQRYGLDVPLFYFSLTTPAPASPPAWQWHGATNQYHRWLMGLFRGDLGTSYREDAPVSGLLAAALQHTLPLTALAAFLSVLITLELSIWLGYHPRWRQLVLAALHAVQSLPLFVVALGLLLLLANPDALAWFPAYGLGEDTGAGPWAQGPGQYLYHAALPTLSLILVSIPGLIIQLDASIRQEIPALYVATARAKGAAPRAVIRRHILRNAVLPVLPLFTELLPSMVAGSVVVEIIYALPGMGRLLAEAASAQDFPVLLGAVLLVALARLISQLFTDVLYQWADPRIRLSV
jgi:peptide/nickel transport system permease protein